MGTECSVLFQLVTVVAKDTKFSVVASHHFPRTQLGLSVSGKQIACWSLGEHENEEEARTQSSIRTPYSIE